MHHPSDVTLGAFASGTLDEARAVVVATHVAVCPQCRRAIRAFEHLGGAQLDATAPAEEMSAGALERAMARLDSTVRPTVAEQVTPVSDLPAPLNQYALGRWRSIGGGLQTRPVHVPSDGDVRVFL